ncbi:transcriptional regulator [Burkholderia sp. 3C]
MVNLGCTRRRIPAPNEINMTQSVVIAPSPRLHNLRMPTLEEKMAFSERLKFALLRSPEKLSGATELALHFNLRHHGEHPVSPQTTHKWLTGRTIPTADKLATLAEWLRVDLHWLHYGPPPTSNALSTPRPLPRDERYPPTQETIELATKIESLSSHHRYLVQELIEQFYGGPPQR